MLRTLERDLDGYVHTSTGFMSRVDYERFREKYPIDEFPKWEDIPLMTPGKPRAESN